jgi:hypothetical protein
LIEREFDSMLFGDADCERELHVVSIWR